MNWASDRGAWLDVRTRAGVVMENGASERVSSCDGEDQGRERSLARMTEKRAESNSSTGT